MVTFKDYNTGEGANLAVILVSSLAQQKIEDMNIRNVENARVRIGYVCFNNKDDLFDFVNW